MSTPQSGDSEGRERAGLVALSGRGSRFVALKPAVVA
jgi:hypothetical protein